MVASMTSKMTSKPQQPRRLPSGFYLKLHFWNQWLPLIKMSYRLSYSENFHFSNLLAASEALMYFWVPDISLSLLSYYLFACMRILEEKKEYSVELKRTWVPSILVFCANFNHFESLDLITEHMACRLQRQMVPRFVIVSNSIEKSDFQKDLSSIVIRF